MESGNSAGKAPVKTSAQALSSVPGGGAIGRGISREVEFAFSMASLRSSSSEDASSSEIARSSAFS